MFLLSSASVFIKSCAMSAVSHTVWTSHCKVHDEPWNHIARPYPLCKGQTARWEEFSDEPWIPERMTSALFWAIDRGKEPNNLATVLLCLALRFPVNSIRCDWCPGALSGAARPPNSVRCAAPLTRPRFKRVIQSHHWHAWLRTTYSAVSFTFLTQTHSFWRYIRTSDLGFHCSTLLHLSSVYLSNHLSIEKRSMTAHR